jgi:DNA replication protein DnaC
VGLRLARVLRETRLGSSCEELEEARRCSLLWLDEVGQEQADPRWLLDLLNDRYERGLVTVTSSGLPKAELEKRYGIGTTRRFTEPEGVTLDLFGDAA